VTDGASGRLTASNLALLGGTTVTLDSINNNVGTLAASGVGALTYVDSNALAIGTVGGTNGLTTTGVIDVATLNGNLTLGQSVSTTNTSATAVTLNAGRDAGVGMTTGGNLLVSGSPTVTTGVGRHGPVAAPAAWAGRHRCQRPWWAPAAGGSATTATRPPPTT